MENPKLALIPSGYKSGTVYSILPTDGVGDFDFSRGSTATRVNKDGLIETVNNNVPRLDWLNSDCPSLLLEPQRTNNIRYSENTTSSDWTNPLGEWSSTSNTQTSPSGQINADTITLNDSNGSLIRIGGVSLTSGTYVVSFWIKDIDGNLLSGNVDIGDVGGGETNPPISSVGSEWVRVERIISITSTKTYIDIQINFSGTSNKISIWGLQVEQGSYPTSYIKTTGSTVTRLKDFIDGAGSSDLFNSLESTFFVEMASFLNAQTNSNGIELAGIGSQNRITLQYDTINNQIRCDVRVLNSAQAIITTSGFDITNFNKMAITYKLNEVKFYVNGQLISTDTSVNTFAPNTLTEVRSTIADISSDAFNLQAKIKDLRVYNRVLTQAEAIELTTI